MYAYKIVFITVFLVISAFAQEAPKWLVQDPDKTGIYFRGESPWYLIKDALVAQAATQDALKDAYAKVSDYFGLNIKSTTTIEQQASLKSSSSAMKQTIQTKTNQLIFDLKPLKTYKEISENEEYFKIHVLLKLDPQTEAKIKAQMKKDEQEYEALKKQILDAINKKDFYKAENLLTLAKGKRAAYLDDTLPHLEARIAKLKAGMLNATMELDKTTFAPDEEIKLAVSLNQKGYLYLFLKGDGTLEMFFPSRYQRDNALDAHESLFFPNEDTPLIAYKELLGKDVELIAVASKKRLAIERFANDVIDGVFLFDTNNKKLRQTLKHCMQQAQCTQTKQKIFIKKQNRYAKMYYTIKASDDIIEQIKSYLRSQGVYQAKTTQKKVVFFINTKKVYSSLLEDYVLQYNVTTKIYYHNKMIKKEKRSFSKEELLAYIKNKLAS